MKQIRVVAALMFAAFLFSSCKKDEPTQPHVSSVQLSVEDVSCTEAWLKVSLTDGAEPRRVALMRDGLVVRTVDLGANDTVFEDAGLLPRQTHGYLAVRMNDSVAVDQSGLVQTTTLDTTSHSFTFTVDSLGNGNSSSYLKDVAIISDNDVWVAGAIYVAGSSDPFNLAHWDGTTWNLVQVMFPICGTSSSAPFPAEAVFTFGQTDVWVTSAGTIARWNGVDWVTTCIPSNELPGSVRKVWGSSPSSMYIVGNLGTIVHYDGSSWHRMESGTTVDLTDVWGTSDGSVVWACGSTSSGIESVLLMYDGQSWRTVWSRSGSTVPPYGDEVTSLWMSGKILYVSSNHGIFQQFGLDASAAPRQIGNVSSFPYHIRGSDKNNVFVVGDPGAIRHYNGMTTSLIDPGTPTHRLYSVAVYGHLVVAVGRDAGSIVAPALVYRGMQ